MILLMAEILNNLRCMNSVVNNGINYLSTGEFTGFLNHQQYTGIRWSVGQAETLKKRHIFQEIRVFFQGQMGPCANFKDHL